MTKTQLINKAAENSKLTKKQLEEAYNAFAQAVEESLCQGESVQISGFGSFAVRTKEAHMGRNPKTNEPISIPASRRVVFLPGKKLKEKVNQ